ncbi:hypothetical protein SKAU_G00027580 [Synaphobranchus kaupii]|uniref:Apoptosis facilitator Bcl-2-like protein 14 n=1 Tax=Synaphobranchus kaupii TaxID=118154 RepID=A0A9Q1GD46_SYNKA|nr:hypothetical protein SKAU_G00027580 [Synaphobranchus kaupii]
MEEIGTNGVVPGVTEDSIEFQLIVAYIRKRRPSRRTVPQSAPKYDAPQPAQASRKKTTGKLKMFLHCIRPQKEDREQQSLPSETDGRGPVFRALGPAGAVIEVTDKLTRIADSVPLDSEDIEADSPDDVIQTIVELLRESGDRLNEEMKTNPSLAELFRGCFTYSLFEKVTSLFLQKADPSDIPSTKIPEQAKVALTFEVTSRLTAVDCHPMNVVMGFGAKYLQENFSSWVQKHGGWEKAFDNEDDEEVQ